MKCLSVKTLVIVLALFLLQGIKAQPFKVAATSDMKRVFEDGYNLPVAYDSIKMYGLRNEIVSGQLLINATKNITGVSVETGELRNSVSGTVIPPSSVTWNFVGSIPLSKNTPNQPASAVVRKAPANFPDYLMAERTLGSIRGKSYKAVWLTIDIPGDAREGRYTGTVTVKSGEGQRSLPVVLEVFPLTLPDERNLKVIEWYSTDFSKFHGISERYSDEWFKMLRVYADNMVAHRQNLFQVPMETVVITKSKDGKFSFDFTRFDQIADVFWSTGKMDYLTTGELTRFGEKSWYDTRILLRDLSVRNESGEIVKLSGEEVLPELLPAFESHLRQKGWLDKTYFGIKDEPSLHNAVSWCEVSAWMHNLAPDLRRIDAIETTKVLKELEIAVPKLDALASWYDTYKKELRDDGELWFYTVGIYQGSLLPNKTIDMPVMDNRLLHWLNYKYDATGFLHWGWNQWTEDPFSEVGMHIGDGWHVYPAKDGVVNSLRWEQMRNGIQDYECFKMLENKVRTLKDSLGSAFSWIDPSHSGKEIASRAVMGFAEHTDDPEVINNARKDLFREITRFSNDPRYYFQMDPPVNSVVTRHSSVSLYGWVKPGSVVKVNDADAYVRHDGLVLVQMGGEFIDERKVPLRDMNVISVSGPGGSDEIIVRYQIR